MQTNEVAGFTPVLITLLSDFWVVLMFGLVHFGFRNHHWLKAMAKHGPKKKHDKDDHELMAVVHGVKTIAVGIILASLSYTIATLIYYLLPANPEMAQGSTMEYWVSVGFGVGVVGMMIAGYSLILSAGGKWLTYVGKLIATLSILFMISALVASYL